MLKKCLRAREKQLIGIELACVASTLEKFNAGEKGLLKKV